MPVYNGIMNINSSISLLDNKDVMAPEDNWRLKRIYRRLIGSRTINIRPLK